MKKRWIPFILACIAAAAILGMRFGAQLEADRQADAQNAQRHLNTTIAVVNGDAGAMVNGGWYNYSAAIINTLGDDFVLVSPAMAQTGFASGAYAAVVTFPSNVSARILSFNAMGPERVELEFQINPNLSEQEYLETFIAITELQLAINTTLASTYVSSILRQFHYAQDHVDGIFQNNLADLFALDIITLGNFTANLELDDVPFVPIQPRELDTPFYMTQVRAFAEEVAGWYLHSYAMASNQFLWMRDGLIRLTDNFPAQEDQWVHMMMAWTRYSEFYGELLDIFFEDVSRHEDELRDWHLETLAWHDALELYQSQVLGWHDISNLWLWDAEDWYMDYTGFLRALQEYAAALDRHHILLDNSLDPVMDDLEAWRGILREYELGMYLQYMAMQAWIEAHDGQANITNTFLRDLRDWYRELRKHHSAMALWYERLNRMHDNLYNVHSDLDGASEIFSGGLERLRAVSVELPPGGFPDVPTLGIVPIPATGAALVVTAPTVVSTGLAAVDVSLYDIAGSLQGDELNVLISNLNNSQNNFNETLSTINAILDSFAVWPAAPCTCYFPLAMFIEPTSTTYSAITASYSYVSGVSSCEFSNFMAQVASLTSQVGILNGQATTLSADASQLSGYAQTTLQGYVTQLQGHITTIRGYVGLFNDEWDYLTCWYGRLQDSIYDIYEWHLGLPEFHYYATLRNDLVQDTVGHISTWHRRASRFERALGNIDIRELWCIEDLMYIATWAYESIPECVRELEMAPLMDWCGSIYQPPEYDGAEIYDVFDVEFPLDFSAIEEVEDLYRPPVFTDYEVPQMVHEHWMLLAYRPTSPLIPPPPRPDNFWYSLNFMHDQLMSFDVEEFLSDDIHQRVENSLVNYEAFLESIRHDITFLFQDNIWLMHDVNAEYNHFLHNLRHDAFAAAAYEQEALQNAIGTFTTLREINNANTISRLGTFANMMPESRAVAGVNQGLVNFTVMPFDFVPMTIRDEVVFEQQESMVGMYVQWQRIALWVVAAVFVATVGSLVVTHLRKKKVIVRNSI